LRRGAARGRRRPRLRRVGRCAGPMADRPAGPAVAPVSGHAVELFSPAIGAAGTVVVHGHWGRPALAFPAEGGDAWEFERKGMVGAAGGLIEGGRVKLYCVDSFDSASWSNRALSLEQRAREHARYESWILDQVVPFVRDDSGGASEIITTGVSLGAFHAANFALKRADVFPLAICLSGNYDPAGWDGWGERGEAAYFNNPLDYVSHLGGDHLTWLRERLSVLLVCGQGQWEDTTGALDSTRRLAALLASKGIRCELDLWGYDTPHDWLKKIALMDDVYLLNSPFTFQSMEKHAAYCAMIRLGLKVPATVLVPHKDPPDNARFQFTAARYNLPFDLSAIAEEIGYPLF